MVPDPHDLPAGCPFAGRCYKVAEACHGARPPMIVVGPDHEVACIRTAVPA
jgi:peptide/nickel transport system ATP-binding protein